MYKGHTSANHADPVFSPGFLHRAGGTRCTVYLSMSLHCFSMLLANGVDNGRCRTVVHWNVPLIIRLPRRVIANLVLASCYKAIRARRLRAMPLLSHLDREHVAPRVKNIHMRTVCA